MKMNYCDDCNWSLVEFEIEEKMTRCWKCERDRVKEEKFKEAFNQLVKLA
jgi:hypothetical protein